MKLKQGKSKTQNHSLTNAWGGGRSDIDFVLRKLNENELKDLGWSDKSVDQMIGLKDIFFNYIISWLLLNIWTFEFRLGGGLGV